MKYLLTYSAEVEGNNGDYNQDFNEVKAALEAKQPSGRFLKPSEVAAAAIAFINLPYTTGQAELLKGE